MKLTTITNPKFILTTLKFVVAMFLAKAMQSKHSDVMIIAERPGQARDNGYCFYRYLKENHPNLEVYYLIERSASDREKIVKYGEESIIDFDSFKHFLFFCISKKHVSAHTAGCCPNNSPITKYIKSKLGYKDIFIPHGVSYGISEFCLKKYTDIDLFVCCGTKEYDNVLKNYGYTEEEVALTGYPRLDYWKDKSFGKRQIVLMPTWRFYISQNPEIDIAQTRYFKAYQPLLNNVNLGKLLEQYGYKLVFYLHDGMQKYSTEFTSNADNVAFAGGDDKYDIQELLMESSLLITDYSSVAFDFAYMKKPVIYYQFDKEDFFDKQYKEGLFSFEDDGFGPVVTEESQVVKILAAFLENACKQSMLYNKRMQAFFTLYDKQNSERVLEAIQGMSC